MVACDLPPKLLENCDSEKAGCLLHSWPTITAVSCLYLWLRVSAAGVDLFASFLCVGHRHKQGHITEIHDRTKFQQDLNRLELSAQNNKMKFN